MNVKVRTLERSAVYNRVSGLRLDEQQHQQADGELEKVRNSVTRNFRHLRRRNLRLRQILNKYKKAELSQRRPRDAPNICMT